MDTTQSIYIQALNICDYIYSVWKAWGAELLFLTKLSASSEADRKTRIRKTDYSHKI